MASRLSAEKVQIKTLQRYHHQYLNSFLEHETLIDALINRPGFLGASPIGYLSILARKPSIEPSDLEEALTVDRTLLRVSAFRGSLFLVPTVDYPIYFRAFNQFLQQRGMQKLESMGINNQKILRYFDLLLSKASKMPFSFLEIIEILFPNNMKRPNNEIINLIVQKLCDIGLLIRALAKGFKGNDFSYAILEKWVPEISLKHDNPENARTETVRRYLKAYGPASIEDIAWWSGFTLSQSMRSVANLKREVVRFSVESYKEDFFGLKETTEIIKKKGLSHDEIQLLPPFDPYTFGWRCKKRLADKEFLPYIFDELKNPTSVIVNNGKVIGLWQFRDTKVNIIEFHIFAPYKDKRPLVLHKIDEWALSVAKLTMALEINVLERELPKPLAQRPIGSFLWPLGKNFEDFGEILNPLEKRNKNTFRQKYLDNDYLVRSHIAS